MIDEPSSYLDVRQRLKAAKVGAAELRRGGVAPCTGVVQGGLFPQECVCGCFCCCQACVRLKQSFVCAGGSSGRALDGGGGRGVLLQACVALSVQQLEIAAGLCRGRVGKGVLANMHSEHVSKQASASC